MPPLRPLAFGDLPERCAVGRVRSGLRAGRPRSGLQAAR